MDYTAQKMKKVIVELIRPLLTAVFYWALRTTKPLFLSENETLRKQLEERRFHPALVKHPSILYGTRLHSNITGLFSRALGLKLFIIERCVKIRLMSNHKDGLLQRLAISDCFYKDTDFWFLNTSCPYSPYSFPNNNTTSDKIVVYTVLTGDYDEVHEVLYKEDGVDYLLFTNNPCITSKTWRIVLIRDEEENLLLSRKIKILAHRYLSSDYVYSIYVDANAVVYGKLSLLTSFLRDEKTLAITRHSERSSVKQELDVCVKRRGIDRNLAEKQYAKYVNAGFKDDIPLMECGLIVRKHKDPTLQELMETWFLEFKEGIHRDQISLPPCISRLNFYDYVVMEGSVWHNQFVKILGHKIVK